MAELVTCCGCGRRFWAQSPPRRAQLARDTGPGAASRLARSDALLRVFAAGSRTGGLRADRAAATHRCMTSRRRRRALEVAVWSYGDLIGSYRLAGNEIVWKGRSVDPFDDWIRKAKGTLHGPILKTDDLHDGWIGRGACPRACGSSRRTGKRFGLSRRSELPARPKRRPVRRLDPQARGHAPRPDPQDRRLPRRLDRPEDGAEEWLRRLPGFLAMRGRANARIRRHVAEHLQ